MRNTLLYFLAALVIFTNKQTDILKMKIKSK